MRCLSKEKRIAAYKKAALMSLHIGYWSVVSGFIISNFLYHGILQEKVRNEHLET
jgi:hypothetical protein